jgi:hypothetical protein
MRRSSQRKQKVKRALAAILVAAIAFQSLSCGTLIHPERRGLRSGRLDPAIVVLDGLGLLIFFVPGVVAFIVDFSTGAIYLPECYAPAPSGPPVVYPQPMTRVQTDPASLNQAKIESIIRERTGKLIDLSSSDVRIERADNVDQATRALRESETSSVK